MENTTITVSKNTRNDLMLFKIKTNAKNIDEVLRTVIKRLKKELNSSSSKGDDVLYNHSKEKKNEQKN